jgi:hypothetical protein
VLGPDTNQKRLPPMKEAAAWEARHLAELAQSGRPDSNRRRPAWEAGILPTELRPRRQQCNVAGAAAGCQ